MAFAALAYAHIETFFTYQPQREWEERAFVAIEKALFVNPELAEAHVAKGLLLWTKSHHFPHENAIAEYRRAIALNPNLAQALAELARVLWHIGLLDDAHQALQKAMELLKKVPPEAIAKINLAVEKGERLGHFHHISNHIAAAYAMMNRKTSALDWLEETAADGFPCSPWFERDPCLESIRNEPRFKRLIKKLKDQWDRFDNTLEGETTRS